MLYSSFRGVMMFCAFMGLVFMLDEEQFTYIIFPIAIIFWGIFSFFDPIDREYLRREGINPDEYSPFFPDDYYSPNHNLYTTNHSTNNSYNPYSPKTVYKNFFSDAYQYKNVAKKCKRNFKITVEK